MEQVPCTCGQNTGEPCRATNHAALITSTHGTTTMTLNGVVQGNRHTRRAQASKKWVKAQQAKERSRAKHHQALAASGTTFMLSPQPIWVQPIATALSVSQPEESI